MQYYKFKVSITGTVFVPMEDVTEMQQAIRANGGSAPDKLVARNMAKERLEELFPDDTLMKLNEVVFVDDLQDPDIFIHQK